MLFRMTHAISLFSEVEFFNFSITTSEKLAPSPRGVARGKFPSRCTFGKWCFGWLFVFFWLSFIGSESSKAEAAAYYVSPSGSDAHPGTSAASPWRTIERVNAAKFQPGDQILLQRGGEWRESLIVGSSGTREKPITFADYGQGAKPRLIGSQVLANSRFVSLGGTLYAYKIDSPVHAVLADHRFLFDALGQPVESVKNSYTWNEGFLKINSSEGDPRTNGRQYTACMREDIIYSKAQNHLKIRNLATDESAKFGGGYGIRIMDSQDISVEGCAVYRAGKHHFGCINSTQVVFRNCYAAYAMPRQGMGGQSAYVSFGDNKDKPHQSSEYLDCTFDHTQDTWDETHGYYFFVSHGSSIGSVLLKNIVSRGAPCSVDNRDNGAIIKIIGGFLENSRLELYGQEILIDGLHMKGTQSTVDISASRCVLQNMSIVGTNLGTAWYQTAVFSRQPQNTVRFCKITLSRSSPDFNTCLAVGENSTNFSYYGNTLISNGEPFKNWGNSSVLEARNNTQKLWKSLD